MSSIIEFTITGIAPLLMHSDRFSNPIAPETIEHKKLTSKRSKSLEDHRDIARSEWMGGLYYDSDIGVYLPTASIRRSLIEGARLHKLGKHISRSVIFLEHKGFPLIYKGPSDPAKLYETPKFVDTRSVKVGTSKLMRNRPRFDEWSCSGQFSFNEAMLSLDELKMAYDAAGHFCGIGDYRPSKDGMFGTYDVELS